KRVAFLRGGGVKVARFPDGKEIPLPKAVSVGGTYAVSKLEFSADGKRLLGPFRVGGVNQLARPDLESRGLTPPGPVSRYFPFARRQVDRPHRDPGPARRAIRQRRLAHGPVEAAGGRRREGREAVPAAGARPRPVLGRRQLARRRRGTRAGPRRPVARAAGRP